MRFAASTSLVKKYMFLNMHDESSVCYIPQDNTAAANHMIGVVTDSTHNNVKNNVCQGNKPKCTGM